MRNVWKGLVVGGLTGVAAGVVLDLGHESSRRAHLVGEKARDHAPDAAEWLTSVTAKAHEWLAQADVPHRVRELSQRIVDSDTADGARHAAGSAAAGAKGTVESMKEMAATLR